MRYPADAEPAFPLPDPKLLPSGLNPRGISVLDYFAAAALQGICVGLDLTVAGVFNQTANNAYRMAAAMTKEKEKIG